MSDEKKSLERNALDAFLQHNRKMEKKYTIDEEERPDFVLTKDDYRIGIEHFRADTILNEHTDSESMKYDGQRKAIFRKHNKTLLNDEFNADDAASDLETSINKSLDAVSKFDYGMFVDNLKDVFNQHADKVSEYKQKCDEVWFLIDIGIEDNHFTSVLGNGGLIKMNTLPVTDDMLYIFEKHKEISRVIVCSRYIGKYKIVYDSGAKPYGYHIRFFTYMDALSPVQRQVKLNVEKSRKEVKCDE